MSSRAIKGWGIAVLVSAAIAISYLDRQTLPWAINAIQADIPFTNEMIAALNSAFLITYGLMYLGGGWLLDRIGTRKGFFLIMAFWSLACASHGFAKNVWSLGFSRLALGFGEGGGFPAATRAVAEWFSPKDRATAMGIINGGTAIGAVVAGPLITWVLLNASWLGFSEWRWVFFLTGVLGLLWLVPWLLFYHTPRDAPGSAAETQAGPVITIPMLLKRRAIVAIAFAKFLTDAAWYFYLFWLPKYLFDALGFDLKMAGSVGWIPYAAAGIGCIIGGGLSSILLRRGHSVNAARKIALGLSAALMPWVMFVPHTESVALVLILFSLAFFGQQSWSTLIMILPTDLVPHRALGKFAGLVGMGGAFGGVVFQQIVGWMLDHGYSYTPILAVAASLHLIAFALICIAVPRLNMLSFQEK